MSLFHWFLFFFTFSTSSPFICLSSDLHFLPSSFVSSCFTHSSFLLLFSFRFLASSDSVPSFFLLLPIFASHFFTPSLYSAGCLLLFHYSLLSLVVSFFFIHLLWFLSFLFYSNSSYFYFLFYHRLP